MVNIYDTANQMEQDLKQTQQYQELKAAYEALKADGKAYACFKELQDLQGNCNKNKCKAISQKKISKNYKKLVLKLRTLKHYKH